MSLASPPEALPGRPEILILNPGTQLVRLYDPSRGNWAAHRFYGPIHDMRFDHHTPPCGVHPARSVWYAATSLRGAVAEVVGRTGILDRGSPGSGIRIAKIELLDSIPILDLLGVKARAVGLTQEIASTTDYVVCQEWARAFYEQYSQIQGMRWRGRQIGSISVVLNDRASMSRMRAMDLALDDPAIWPRIARAARDCGLAIVG